MISDSPTAQPQPAWLRFAPFLAVPPVLSSRQWAILLQVAVAMAVATYTTALLTLALPQIQRDLNIATAQLSSILAIIRLGALCAFLVSVAADRLGRRRMMLGSITAVAVLALATAAAPTVAAFVVLQFLARAMTASVALLAGVFVVEEFPDGARGWGVGALTAVASFGGGVAALLFALVDILPFGWRALTALGAVGFVVTMRMGRQLPETTRFIAAQANRPTPVARKTSAPLLRLIRTYPLRLLGLASLIILFNLGGDAGLIYDATYLQQRHGWQPWQISLLNMCAGFMALIGSTWAGRLGDRVGRKRTLVIFLLGFPLFIMAYYNASGWLLPILWAGLLFTSIGAVVAVSTVSNELFPTASRSTAVGVTGAIATLFGALSLAVHGWLLPLIGSPWVTVSVLAGLVLLAPIFVTLLPETSGRRLEEIAPE